jgi:DNA invertase Pin-like site-specific DNA recombinase
MRAAIYARVSTSDQEVANQLLELRGYAAARGWTTREYIDEGISGAKDRRPALDAMLADARRRRFDCVVVWSLDRLGRSLKHLVVVLDDLQALGVSFVSVKEGLDWTTPSGRLQAQLLAMIAEFERSRLQERVRAGLDRARAQGRRLGRPPVAIDPEALQAVSGLTVRDAAARLGVSTATLKRLRRGSKTPSNGASISA